MLLQEAKSALYDEIVNFAKNNPQDHSYKNFTRQASEWISEKEYGNIYWTLVNTHEIKEGPGAPSKRKPEDIINYLEQRVKQIEKKVNREASGKSNVREFSPAAPPKEDKTGQYNKYKTNEDAPSDLRASFETDDEDIEITDDSQTAKDIFDEMNAYVSSIMQKRSTKPHLIIAGAPG